MDQAINLLCGCAMAFKLVKVSSQNNGKFFPLIFPGFDLFLHFTVKVDFYYIYLICVCLYVCACRRACVEVR